MQPKVPQTTRTTSAFSIVFLLITASLAGLAAVPGAVAQVHEACDPTATTSGDPTSDECHENVLVSPLPETLGEHVIPATATPDRAHVLASDWPVSLDLTLTHAGSSSDPGALGQIREIELPDVTGPPGIQFTSGTGQKSTADDWDCTRSQPSSLVCTADAGAELQPGDDVRLTLDVTITPSVNPTQAGKAIDVTASVRGLVLGEVGPVESEATFSVTVYDDLTITGAEFRETSSADGAVDEVLVTFSRDLGTTPSADGFTLTYGGDEMTVAGVSAGASNSEIVLTVSGLPAGDTALASGLQLDYAAGSASTPAKDGNGLEAEAVSAKPVSDGAAPVILSAEGEKDGRKLVLTFSEAVEGSGSNDEVQIIDLTYNDASGDGVADLTGATVDHTGAVVKIELPSGTTFTAADLTGTPDQIAAKADIKDVADNAADTTPVSLGELDQLVLSSAETIGDGNGFVNGITLTFSQDLPNGVLSDLEEEEWTLEGFDFSDLTFVDSVAGDAVLRVDFPSVEGTDVTPLITYDPTAGSDTSAAITASGSAGTLALLPVTDFKPDDGAAPILLKTRAVDDTDFGRMFFSEPVFHNEAGEADGPLLPEDLTIGTLGIDDLVTDDDVVFDIDFADDLADLSPAVTAVNGVDASDNPVDFSLDATLTQFAGPAATAASVTDSDHDGHIDALTVQFDAGIAGDGLVDALGEWDVTFGAVTYGVSGIALDADDASTLHLTLEQTAPGEGDTDATPDVLYAFDGAGIFGLDGELISADLTGATDVVDLAQPVLYSASANPGSDKVTLTFSEPVHGASAAGTTCASSGGSLLLTQIDFGDADGSGPEYIARVFEHLASADDRDVILQMNTAFRFEDLDPAGTPDNFTVRASVLDCNDNALFEKTLDLADLQPPTVESVETQDLDGDGFLDAFQVTTNEAIEETSLSASGWLVDDALGPYGADLQAHKTVTVDGVTHGGESTVFFLTFAELSSIDADAAPDTGARPELKYDGSGSITDLAGRDLDATSGFLTPDDGAAPVVVSAATIDDSTDPNGILDAYKLTFSEPVACTDASGFAVAGRTVLGATCGPDLVLTFEEGASRDTAMTPQVTYDGTGNVLDAATDANALAAFLDGDIVETDGAPAVLWRITANPGESTATAYFSEAVDNGAGGPLLTDHFEYTDGSTDGVNDIIAVEQLTQQTFLLTLGAGTTEQDLSAADFAADKVSLDPASPVFGLDDRIAIGSMVEFTDVSGPIVKQVVAVETGTPDGVLDEIHVIFHEAMRDVNDDGDTVLEAADFDVSGSGFLVDAATVAGDTIELTLVPESDPVVGTGAPTWQLTYDATLGDFPDPFEDANGNAFADGVLLDIEDGAGPVIVGASGFDGEDFFQVRFSEPVYGSGGDGELVAGDLVFEAGTGTQTINEVMHEAGDAWAHVSLSAAADFTADTPTIGWDTTGAKDAVDLAAVGDAVTILAVPELAPPTLATVDADKDGMIDAIRLTFSEVLVEPDGGYATDAFADSFALSDAYVVDTVTADPGDEKSLLLQISTPDQDFDTDATPTVTYARDPDAPITDGTATLASFDPIGAVDAARPVIAYAHANPGLDSVEIRFSEPVKPSSGTDLLLNHFVYSSSNGGAFSLFGAVVKQTPTASEFEEGEVYTVTTDVPVTFLDLGSDGIGAKLSVVEDGPASPLSADPLVRKLSDVDAPVITGAVTRDADGDGFLDAVDVMFNEFIDAASVDAGGFKVAGYSVTGAASTDDDVVRVTLLEDTASGGDTDNKPDVTYDEVDGAVADLSGIALGDATQASDDGAAAVLMSATTVDDGDGRIDAYDLVFSEAVDASSPIPDGWTVGVDAATGATQPGAANTLRIAFDPIEGDLEGSTGQTPQVTYTSPGPSLALKGADGLAVRDVTVGAVDEVDGAAPVLMYVVGQPGETRLTAKFSEGVDNGATPPLGLSTFHFAIRDSTPADIEDAILDVEHTEGDDEVVLVLSAPWGEDALADAATVRIGADTVFESDASPALSAPTADLALRDLVVPTIVSVETGDDGDGILDEIVVTFDEDLSFQWDDTPTGYEAGDFTIGPGYEITDVKKGANDKEIVLSIEQMLAEGATPAFDTGATPIIGYNASRGEATTSIVDASTDANPIPSFSQDADDKAVPFLVSVETHDAAPQDGFLDEIRLTYSEDLDTSNLEVQDFSVTSGTDEPVYAVSNVLAQDNAIKVLIGQDVASDADPVPDTGITPTLTYDPTGGDSGLSFQDEHQNDAGSLTAEPSSDKAAPFPVDIVTAEDASPDGTLDEIVITFSEPLDNGGSVTDAEFLVSRFASVTASGTDDDPTVTLTIAGTESEPAPEGTGIKPRVTYMPPEAPLNDTAENTVAMFAIDAADGAAPIVLAAKTVDATGNGILDGYFVEFSEPMDDSSFVAADWKVAGVDATQLRTGTIDDDDFIIMFDEAGDDTSATPVLTHTSTDGLSDLAGNKLAALVDDDVAEEDGAPPVVIDAYTLDDVPNGFVDTIKVVFSEDLNATTFEADEFTEDLAWWKPIAEGGATLSGDTVTIALVEGYEWDDGLVKPFDTNSTLEFFYMPDESPVEDTAGLAFAGDIIDVRDGAAPYLAAARIVDDDTVEAVFSEPVFAAFTDGVPSGDLAAANFTYTDDDEDAANQTLDSVAHVAGDRIATLTFTGDPFVDGDADALAAATDAIKDAVGNAASDASVGLAMLPYIVSATSVDTSGNGFIDAIEIELSIPIDDVAEGAGPEGVDVSNLVDEHWWLLFGGEGWDDGWDVVTSLEADAGADDEFIYWKPTPACWDDGDGPECLGDMPGLEIGYFGDSIHALGDADKKLLPNVRVPVMDGIVPAISAAVSEDVDDDGILDTVAVSFSEAVTGSTTPGDWLVGEVEPANVAVDVDGTVLMLPAGHGITTHAPTVSYTGDGLKDAAGNAVKEADAFPAADGVDPVINSVASAGPGHKEITLTFSEPVFGSGDQGDAKGGLLPADILQYGDDTTLFPAPVTTIVSNAAGVVVVEVADGLAPQTDGQYLFGPAGSVEDAAGNPVISRRLPVSLDDVAPAQVSDLGIVADSVLANELRLSWSPVGDDGDVGTPADYEVFLHSADFTDAATATLADTVSFQPAQLLAGDATEDQVAVVGGLEKSTTYFLAVRAVDEAGNKGPLSATVSTTTLDDATPPVGTLTVSSTTHTSGEASNIADATFTWNELTDEESEVAYYTKVNDQATYTVTTSDDLASQRSLALTGLTDGTHYVHVAAISGGGAKQATAFQLVIDTQAPAKIADLASSQENPLSLELTWTTPADAGLDRYELRYSTDAFTAADFASQDLATGLPAPASGATSYELTGLLPDTTYYVAIRLVDEAGNKGPVSDVLEVDTAPDSTAPTGDLDLTSTTHTEDTASLINDVTFVWDSASDLESSVQYRYVLNDDPDYVLTDSDSVTSDTQVALQGVGAGTHYFHVAAESAGGRGEQSTFKLVIDQVTDEQLQEVNLGVKTKVTRVGDTNVIEWQLPSDVPGDVKGVQVLRSNSPYQVIATIDAGSSDYANGSFVDDSDQALESSKYLVTMFFEGDVGMYDGTGTVDVAEELDSTAASAPTTGGLGSSVAFYVSLIALLASIALLVVAVVMRQKESIPKEVHE